MYFYFFQINILLKNKKILNIIMSRNKNKSIKSLKDIPTDLENMIINYKEQLEKSEIEDIALSYLFRIVGSTSILIKNQSKLPIIATFLGNIGYKRIKTNKLVILTKPEVNNIVNKLQKELKIEVLPEKKELYLLDLNLISKGFIRTLNRITKNQQSGGMRKKKVIKKRTKK